MQSACLLARVVLSAQQLANVESLFDGEPDAYVQAAMASVLAQKRKDDDRILRKFVFHENDKVRDIGKLFRANKHDVATAQAKLDHIFRPGMGWIACDNMCFVHLMSVSTNVEVRRALLNAIRSPRFQHEIGDVRAVLRSVFTRVRESLRP
jgi:hypothetical protein